MALTKIDDRGLKTPIDLLDSEKIRFGTGNDLEIQHTGSNAHIDNNTGSSYFNAASNFYFQTNNTEAAITCTANGAVELYYDGAIKLTTEGTAVKVFGLFVPSANDTYHLGIDSLRWQDLYISNDIDILDNGKILLGTGDDLEIYHDGSNSYIKNTTGNFELTCDEFRLKTVTGNEAIIQASQQGAVDLYYDNVKKLDTLAGGVQVHGNLYQHDNAKAVYGTGDDLQIYHDGSDSFINDSGTGNLKILTNSLKVLNAANTEHMAQFNEDGSVDLYYDNVKKFETTSTGTKITGQSVIDGDAIWNGSDGSWGAFWDKSANIVSFKDSAKIGFGTSNDLQIYHDGSHSFIHQDGTGNLAFLSDNYYLNNEANTENIITAVANGAVSLYFDDSKKFETTSTGATLTGALVTTQLNVTNGLSANLTTSGQDILVGDSTSLISFKNRVRFGDGEDLQLFHSGTHSYIQNTTGNLLIESGTTVLRSTSQENYFTGTLNGSVNLYYDNVQKINTNASGVDIGTSSNACHLMLFDGGQARFGTGQDLQIYHDGSHSYVDQSDSGTGNLHIRGNGSDVVKIQAKKGEQSIICNPDGAVDIYHDNNKKFNTDPDGVQITGFLQAHGNISDSDYTNHDWHVLQSNDNNKSAFIIEHSGDSGPYGLFIDFSDHSPDNNANYFLSFDDSTTNRFKVYSDGDVKNHDNSYGSISDIKLKENIVDAGSQWDDIKAVKVRNFNFKTNQSKKLLGVVAQELETVSPGLVSDDPDMDKYNNDLGTTTKSVKYSILYMKAIKALQEAMAKIEVLETKVAALESS